MQHFSTLGNAAYKFFKTSVLIPRGQSVSAVTGGGLNIFAKIDSTLPQRIYIQRVILAKKA